jgi:hypothetical protein
MKGIFMNNKLLTLLSVCLVCAQGAYAMNASDDTQKEQEELYEQLNSAQSEGSKNIIVASNPTLVGFDNNGDPIVIPYLSTGKKYNKGTILCLPYVPKKSGN